VVLINVGTAQMTKGQVGLSDRSGCPTPLSHRYAQETDEFSLQKHQSLPAHSDSGRLLLAKPADTTDAQNDPAGSWVCQVFGTF